MHARHVSSNLLLFNIRVKTPPKYGCRENFTNFSINFYYAARVKRKKIFSQTFEVRRAETIHNAETCQPFFSLSVSSSILYYFVPKHEFTLVSLRYNSYFRSKQGESASE